MEIIKGKMPGAKKVIVYGPEGIGKSTFASRFPDPVFIDTEGSTKDMDVARFLAPSSWQMLLEQIRFIIQHPETCKTLVIDTADWAEQLCVTEICSRYQKSGIEDFGYGKGYTYLQEGYGQFLNLLSELVEQKGINVVLTAHAKMRKFEQPDEMGTYDRWEMKLSKQVAPIVKEWADMVLFANYKIHVVKIDGKNKAQGGCRVMYTSHHPCWDAKNRYGLPEEVPFEYESIAHILQDAAKAHPQEVRIAAPDPEPVKSSQELKEKIPPAAPAVAEQLNLPLDEPPEQESPGKLHLDERIPKNLRDLMELHGVDMWDLENVVEARGYVPAGTPCWEFDTVNPGIVDGLLVPSWNQVYAAIKEMKEKQEIPFN